MAPIIWLLVFFSELGLDLWHVTNLTSGFLSFSPSVWPSRREADSQFKDVYAAARLPCFDSRANLPLFFLLWFEVKINDQ